MSRAELTWRIDADVNGLREILVNTGDQPIYLVKPREPFTPVEPMKINVGDQILLSKPVITISET